MSIQVREIEKSIEDAREMVELRDALHRLNDHPDFKKVIREAYLHNEPVRLVHLKAAPAMQRPEHQEGILKSIDGVGSLLTFFRTIEIAGERASDAIVDAEAALEEIANDDVEA
jgi:hypothetical protein